MTFSRRSFFTTCGLTAAGGAGLLAGAGPAAAAAGTTSVVSPTTAAASFLDSVGVNAHWGYLDTPYGSAYEQVRSLLVASGVRHVRSWETNRIAELAARGVRTTVLVDSDQQGRGDPVQVLQDLAPHAVSGALAAVEGPNESDISWSGGRRSYRGESFPAGPASWQEVMYETVKGDPRLSGLTVIGMSFGGTYWGGGHPFAAGSLQGTTDWGNFHPYPSGNPYTDQYPYAGIQQYYANADFPSVALDVHPLNFEVYRPPFGDRPMASTETGYSTWKWGQSERTQGRYLPRMFMENYRLGIKRTYTYEFLDSFADPSGGNREAHFGWLRHDLSPKPAYRAVQSMLRVVRTASTPAPAQDGSLEASLTVVPPAGYDAAALHHLSLRRDDGSFVLVLWHEVSANDLTGLSQVPRRPLRELTHPAVVVTVDLHRSTSGVSATYIDDAGALRSKALSRTGTAVTALVGDRLTFVTIPALAASTQRTTAR